MSEKKKVLVCALTGVERTNWINPDLTMMIFHMARDARFQVEYANIKDSRPVECARNNALVLARDHGFDWCIQIDNDNYMPTGTPLDIVASAGPEHSVIGLGYSVGNMQQGYSVFPPEAATPFRTPFQEVPDVAGGMLMVHRSVWQKIPRGPWFRWNHGEPTETLDRGTNGCGEDIAFCRLVREHGLKVWTHAQPAGHYRTTDLTGMTVTLSQLTQQAQAAHAVPRISPQANRWITP
jgi:hypothetical protein